MRLSVGRLGDYSKWLAGEGTADRRKAGKQTAEPAQSGPVMSRFLGSQRERYEAFLQTAKTYVELGGTSGVSYLYRKPFAVTPNDGTFFSALYQVLNILQAMDLPARGRVLEVGSGPGWLTEILVMLGFQVDAVEPCEDMVRIARDRLNGCSLHYHLEKPPAVQFHCQAFEECELADGTFDGVLFYESLHHMIDENACLAKCFRALKPGGVLGIAGESAWIPGWRQLEDRLREEMEQYGTLENPFTVHLLSKLLHDHGFEDVLLYHGVNGLFPVDRERLTLREVAQFPAWGYNTFTARKPGVPTTARGEFETRARIKILEQGDGADRRLALKIKLENVGETRWLSRGADGGHVTVALREGAPGSRDASGRWPLPHSVDPGQEITLDVVFYMPDGPLGETWWLDLVNEKRFWFSERGTIPAAVHLGQYQI